MDFRHIITLGMLIIMQFTFSFGQSSSNRSNEQSSNTSSYSLSNGKAKKVKPILRKRTPTLAILPLTNANPVSRKVGYGNSIASMLQTQIRNETNFLVLFQKIAEPFGPARPIHAKSEFFRPGKMALLHSRL